MNAESQREEVFRAQANAYWQGASDMAEAARVVMRALDPVTEAERRESAILVAEQLDRLEAGTLDIQRFRAVVMGKEIARYCAYYGFASAEAKRLWRLLGLH